MVVSVRRTLSWCALLWLGSVPAALAADSPAGGRAYLLNVARGQLPNDTGSDQMKITLVDQQADLGGKAIKVEFLPADSFGDRASKVENWKPFARLRFEAFNPTQQPVGLTLNVNHRRTTGYPTRAVAAFRLVPGKNSIELGVDEIVNVNGSAPDLSKVLKWFIAIGEGPAPTLFFGDIYLEGAIPAEPGTASAGRAARYQIKGKVGDLEVNLTATPVAGEAVAARPAPARTGGDPARLQRLRAATMPKLDKPTSFDTPAADAVLAALEVFPPDNPWNLLVGDWPRHADSQRIVAAIGADKPLRYNADMGFVLVPAGQKRVPVALTEYAGESDPGPYPVPDNTPIEGWPANYLARRDGKPPTLDDVQRDRLKEGGDRHAIVLDPANRLLYEFYAMRKTEQGWTAAGAATFDLKSNRMRPDGWTSTDAAGLPTFPAVVRHDELQRGQIDHALRVTVPRSRKSYVYPATHHAGHGTEDNLPRMGERLRLRADFDVSTFGPEVRTILTALKRYGMFVADNGIAWALSVTPDPRIPNLNDELRRLKGSDFEVVTPPPGYQPAE